MIIELQGLQFFGSAETLADEIDINAFAMKSLSITELAKTVQKMLGEAKSVD